VDLYIHSPVRLNGAVLSYLRTGTTLSHFTLCYKNQRNILPPSSGYNRDLLGSKLSTNISVNVYRLYGVTSHEITFFTVTTMRISDLTFVRFNFVFFKKVLQMLVPWPHYRVKYLIRIQQLLPTVKVLIVVLYSLFLIHYKTRK
jgi:hypothetical protein